MKKLIDLPLEKMINSLNELGAPSEYEPTVKKIITELTPNRPDWYSMEGLARSLRAYHHKKHPQYGAKKSEYKVVVDASVAKIRPYTVCAVITDLKLDDQRIKDMVLLQEKLLATLGRKVKRFGLGLYPLDAIKFPLRYTTMKPDEIRYIPLGHEKEMTAEEILKAHKKGEQYGHLIRNFERYPVFVDADGKVMALIPIVNSAETGKVDETTKNMFIEVTGTDINACSAALNILVCTFADMGGTIHTVNVAYGKRTIHTPDLAPKTMPLELEKINKALGLGLKDKDAVALLERMGYGFAGGKVKVAPYRADVLCWVDIMEDIAISYGYNNFKATLPDFFSAGKLNDEHRRMDETMRGMGFLEAKTFILTNKEKLASIGCDKGDVEISNPGSVDFTVVRPNLQVDILDVFSTNKMKGLPQRFYEIGIVYEKGKQGKKLIFGVMDKRLDFSNVRGYLQTLGVEMGWEITLEKTPLAIFEPETSCLVLNRGKRIGVLGKVDGRILDKYGLSFDVYVCELDVW